MVGEIRRGNLNLTGPAPGSIEFGPLVKGFVEMAGDLREMRDSLERKVAERTAKLEATQKELVQAAKLSSLGQLVSGVAHELNNPLTSILGFSEVGLMRKDLDPPMRHQLQTIRSEALRLKNLVANLSSFARRTPQRMARLDLRRVLDRIVDLRRYQLTAGNIQLHYDSPLLPVWTQGDADQLTQVFFNLVLNSEQAIKECRNQGDIWLACGAEAEGVWGSVRDNGAGMSSAIQERIFDPFFTTKPVGQGTGLGLSISHGIIEQHHGKIVVESAEGQGTAIRISLPAGGPALKAPATAGEKPAAAEARELCGQRALVIDDEPAITQMLEHYLKGHDWDCVVLNDATALESHLADQRFDAVICDLKMPRRNGLEVLRLLRQQRPELARRFVLITGNLAEGAEKEIVELAGVPVVRKPFTIAQLAETLRALLPDNDQPEKA
jgi:two-component system NtrC family sensor kinase